MWEGGSHWSKPQKRAREDSEPTPYGHCLAGRRCKDHAHLYLLSTVAPITCIRKNVEGIEERKQIFEVLADAFVLAWGVATSSVSAIPETGVLSVVDVIIEVFARVRNQHGMTHHQRIRRGGGHQPWQARPQGCSQQLSHSSKLHLPFWAGGVKAVLV